MTYKILTTHKNDESEEPIPTKTGLTRGDAIEEIARIHNIWVSGKKSPDAIELSSSGIKVVFSRLDWWFKAWMVEE